MRKIFQQKIGVTEEGARGLEKSTWASFAMFITNMLPVVLLFFFIRDLVEGREISVGLYVGLAAVIILVMALVLTVQYNLSYNETYKEAANLRIALSEKMAKLPMSYYSRHDLSDLAQTCMADVTALEHALSHSIHQIVGFVMMLTLIGVMLLVGDWRLGLCVLIPTVIYLALIVFSRKVQVKAYTEYYDQLRSNSEAFQEAIELQQEIKSFDLRDEVSTELNERMDETEKIHIRSELLSVIPMALGGIIQNIAIAVLLIVGLGLALDDKVSVLWVVGYLLAAMKIRDGVQLMAGNITELYYLSPAINRIKEIRNVEPLQGSDVELHSFDIAVDDVDFSYQPREREFAEVNGMLVDVVDKSETLSASTQANGLVLDGVTLTAEQGKVTALVGKSGCGKSTVLRVLARLYDPDSGRITVGDVDIATISTRSLYDNISMVFQEVNLFNSSVMENIRLGRAGATDDEVREAARLANCDGFIERLPQGYDTHIGENGTNLSGGQRQRLSIARAFLKDAPIILLDEISASLDVENEQAIQQSLNKLIKGKTVVIISHRMKAIQNVNSIVVMDDGTVLESGTHDQLMAGTGAGARVYQDLVAKSAQAESFTY